MKHLTFEQIFLLPQLSIATVGLLLPPSPGLYFVLEHSPTKQIIYIGKAINLQHRWKNHHRVKDLLLLEAIGAEISVAFTPGVVAYDEGLLYSDESFLIQKFKPLLNGWSTPIKYRNKTEVDPDCSGLELSVESESSNDEAKSATIDVEVNGVTSGVWTRTDPQSSESGLALPQVEAVPVECPTAADSENNRAKIAEFRKMGMNKTQIILAIWGAKAGGSKAYKQAIEEYKQLECSTEGSPLEWKSNVAKPGYPASILDAGAVRRLVTEMIQQEMTQAQIIKSVWGVSEGGSNRYEQARTEFKHLTNNNSEQDD